jgi:hypothetical protein
MVPFRIVHWSEACLHKVTHLSPPVFQWRLYRGSPGKSQHFVYMEAAFSAERFITQASGALICFISYLGPNFYWDLRVLFPGTAGVSPAEFRR